jgi:predicted histone-like DNA-binding protein
MATSKIEMKYNLRQFNNDKSSAHMLWFPRAVRNSTLNLRGLSDHISSHGSVYTNDVVGGVLTKFKECLVELVSEGTAVKIDGLGTFYPSLEAKGAEDPVGYNINEYLEGVHVRFLPENAEDDRITSRAFLNKVALSQNMIFDINGVPKKVKNGQLVDYGNDDDDEG